MSVAKKCDVCGNVFDFGFLVNISLQGGMDFTNIAKHRFDIGNKDICECCFYKIKNISNSLENKNGKETI